MPHLHIPQKTQAKKPCAGAGRKYVGHIDDPWQIQTHDSHDHIPRFFIFNSGMDPLGTPTMTSMQQHSFYQSVINSTWSHDMVKWDMRLQWSHHNVSSSSFWKGARWVVSRDLYISEKLGGHLTSPSQKGQQKIASFGHFAFSLSPSFAVSKLTVFLLRPCPCCKRCREDMQLLEDTCERERIQRNELNRHLSISLIIIFYTILSKEILGFESLSHFFRCENTRWKLSSKVTSESQGDKHQVLQLLNRYWIASQESTAELLESCWPISPKNWPYKWEVLGL